MSITDRELADYDGIHKDNMQESAISVDKYPDLASGC
jgi:hypothetical protein